MELYKKHRPKKLSSLLGQSGAVAMLQKMVAKKKVPHTILMTGGSGCGKTTTARILKKLLNCSDADFTEQNCADFRGIDMVREIRTRMRHSPMDGDVRMWVIDEAHQLSKDAQNAFLKILEDTPEHVYFVLCTTEPDKLLNTIRTRATEIKLQSLSRKDQLKLIGRVCQKEEFEISDKVCEKLVEIADGSPRKALVWLEQCASCEDDKTRLSLLEKADTKEKAIELVRALMNPRTRWPDVAKIIKSVQDEPETIRHMALSYASNVMLGSGKLTDRAFLVIEAFRDNWYDSKRAGLVASCYEVVVSSKR